jgi:hypothetical protein
MPMSANAESLSRERAFSLGHVPAWVWLGASVYLLLLTVGSSLLGDSDTFWHIAAGKSILDRHAFPSVDIYSFTKTGVPWISTSWLAQVIYAESYELGGWAGPVVLAAASIAAAFALLAFIVGRRIPRTYAIIVTLATLVLSTPHLLARPHVLALPVMVAWVNGLVSASERRQAPSFWLLPLIGLWANLHGGFIFGLALVAPFAFDALWNAEAPQRISLALRWIVFGICAFAASCATPYGWESIVASRKILELGDLLHVISEWRSADFSHVTPFEVCLFALIAATLHYGVKLSPPRLLLVLGLFYMALSHVRNIEIFALLMPLVLLTPLSSQFGLQAARVVNMSLPIASAVTLVALLGAATWAIAAHHRFSPPADQSPVAAVDVLKDRNVKRVLNDLSFGGYLISRDMPVFIDGRAELYGEHFGMEFLRALQLQNVNLFLDLLEKYNIDAVLLPPSTPAASLLDRLDGWQRIYSDDNAVVHIRAAKGGLK